MSGPLAPSLWINLFLPQLPRQGTALDLACGGGRHLRLLHAHGLSVTGVDRDLSGVADLQEQAGIELIAADLEDGSPWPLSERAFDVVLVTNYLWRPLLPLIVAAVAPGGWLLYETFARGHERFGRPSNPDFLLADGELLRAVAGRLAVVAFEQIETEEPALRQRIAARNISPRP